MKNKRGFSLVELLAVIILLGVILLIAIPSYNKYIIKTEDKLFDTYEYAMKDAAEMFVQQCLVKNECPDKNIRYDNILGQKLSLNTLIQSLNLKQGFDGCKLDDSFVKVDYNNLLNSETQIDNYEYKVCLICGEHKSQYCENKDEISDIPNAEDDKIIDLDNNQSQNQEENNVIEIVRYTNTYDYVFKDNKFDISSMETYPLDKCIGDKKGGLVCRLNKAHFGTSSELNLTFESKTSKVILTIIYDDEAPTPKIISVSNEESWTKDKEVEIKLDDNYGTDAIELNTLTLSNKETSNNLEVSPSGISFKTKIEANDSRNGKYEVCVNDKAKNKGCTEFELKITNASPTIEIILNDIFKNTQSFSIKPGEEGMKSIDNLKIMISDMENPTAASELEEIESYEVENNNYTFKPKSSGEKYIFIQEYKNEAGISSIKNNNYIEIENVKYHRYGPTKIDVTPPTCKIVAKFGDKEIKEEDKVVYPMLRLEIVEKIDDHSSINYSVWEEQGGQETMSVGENKEYIYKLRDSANNYGQCSYDTTINNQISTSNFVEIKFIYNGEEEKPKGEGVYEWLNSTVTLGVKMKSRSDADLSYYVYNDEAKKTIDAKEIEIANLQKFAFSGNYQGKVSVTIENNGDFFTQSIYTEFLIDITKPYTPYIYGIDENKTSNINKVSLSQDCEVPSNTKDVDCTIEYTDPAILSKLSIASVDDHSGIATIMGYLYSVNKEDWDSVNEYNFKEKIEELTKDNDVGNYDTVYLKSKDLVGNESNILTITYIRR